jgi:hypothetical protein
MSREVNAPDGIRTPGGEARRERFVLSAARRLDIHDEVEPPFPLGDQLSVSKALTQQFSSRWAGKVPGPFE